MAVSPAPHTTAEIYHGGRYPVIYTWDRQLILALGLALVIMGFLLSVCVVLENYFFGKLRFQLNRIWSFLQCINSITCLAFTVGYAGYLSENGDWFFRCPRMEVLSLTSGLQDAGLITGMTVEVGIIVAANYSLFYMKREINLTLELVGYVFATLIYVASFSGLFAYYSHNAVEGVCGKDYVEARKVLSETNLVPMIPPLSFLTASIIVAYIVLFLGRRRQRRVWQEQMDDDLLDEVQLDVRKRLILAQMSIVKEVVDVFERTLGAFLAVFLGFFFAMIGYFIVDHHFAAGTILFDVGIFVRNSQPLLQAVAYISAESNRDNFSLSRWISRREGMKNRKKVIFQDEAESYAGTERLISED
eukprot:m.24042 g.24042  ORF g.24042 m.24042 type:complete len:360 (+) comp7569_c0_seq1:98-1177(+)